MYIFRVSFDRSDAIRKGDTDAEILNIIHDTVMKKKKQHAGIYKTKFTEFNYLSNVITLHVTYPTQLSRINYECNATIS